MKNFKTDSKTNIYYAYVPTGHKKSNEIPEYRKIRAKSLKSLEEKINKMGGNK